MPLNLVKIGTSAVYGVVDIGAEYADDKQNYVKPFENIADWERVVATFGGAAMAYMDRSNRMMGQIGESLMLSSIPLTEKSVYNAVKSVMPTKAGSRGITLSKKNAPLLKPVGEAY